MSRAERDIEVADRTRAEIGRTTLLNRLRCHEEELVSLRLLGGTALNGVLERVGVDWLLLAGPPDVVVPMTAVGAVVNLPLDSVSPSGVESVSSRLTFSSAMRGLATDRARVTVLLTDQSVVSGTPDRVGRDYVDIAVHHDDLAPRAAAVMMRSTVAFSAISSVVRNSGAWG